MKAIYTITVKKKVQVNYIIEPMTIDEVDVSWKYTKNNELENLILKVSRIPMDIDREGYICTRDYTEIEGKVYKVAQYIANNCFIQMGLDIIDSSSILYASPELLPESTEEKVMFDTNPKKEHSSILGEIPFQLPFNPEKWLPYKVSSAIACYSDALRVDNIILKYEQFYNVIGYFFNTKGQELDKEVSNYVSNYDNLFTEEKIMTLRRLRNRCVHASIPTHINSEKIYRVREIYEELNNIARLAKLLIIHKGLE